VQCDDSSFVFDRNTVDAVEQMAHVRCDAPEAAAAAAGHDRSNVDEAWADYAKAMKRQIEHMPAERRPLP
jgi:hypothetical protein